MSSHNQVNRNFAHTFLRNQIGQRSNQPSFVPNKQFSNPEKLQQMRAEQAITLEHRVNCMNLHANNDILITGGNESKIQIWDWKRKKILLSFQDEQREDFSQIKFLNLHGCWHVLTAGNNGFVKLFLLDPNGIRFTKNLERHYKRVNCLVPSPDNSPVFYTAGNNGTVVLHDLRTSTSHKILCLSAIDAEIYAMDFHPSAQKFAVGGNFYNIKIYDIRNLNKDRSLVPYANTETGYSFISSIKYNRNGNEFLSAYANGVTLFDNSSGFAKKQGYYHGVRNSILSKDTKFFGCNSEFVVSASDCGNLFIWEKKSQGLILYLEGGPTARAPCVEVHSELPYIFTSSVDRVLKIWTPTSGDVFSDYLKMRTMVNRNAFMNHMYTFHVPGITNYNYRIYGSGFPDNIEIYQLRHWEI